jgi:uncharacterized protein
MTIPLTYPGVRVVEVPSTVRTIVGVPTSITAFIGRARRGPIDLPQTVNSFAEFTRIFGDVWTESALAQHVADFFRQGGGAAVVVRVHRAKAGDTTKLVFGSATGTLTLEAASPGTWGTRLSATLDRVTRDNADAKLYRLTLADTAPNGRTEVYDNVSIDPTSPNRLNLVLEQRSTLMRVSGNLPTTAVIGPAEVVTKTWGAAADGGTDGDPVTDAEYVGGTLASQKKGIYALDRTDDVNLIVVPPYAVGDIGAQVRTDVLAYARTRRAIFVMDPPMGWTDVAKAVEGKVGAADFPVDENAAVYFPRVRQPDPTADGLITTVAASGSVAGVIASTDAQRGVWKAPAGLDARFLGVDSLDLPLTDEEIGRLNPVGVNCLRAAPGVGPVVWGARTRVGADRLSSQWKYLPIRRTALYIEESLYRGLTWAVFEPNDEPLWSQIRLNVGAFMNGLFRQGAFQGTAARDAYFVKCDKDTTTQADRDLGVVNIDVGFAPLKPAEFVVLRLQQMAGQITT